MEKVRIFASGNVPVVDKVTARSVVEVSSLQDIRDEKKPPFDAQERPG